MGVLHHLSLSVDDPPAWEQFLATLDDGDSVVLLDQAARAIQRDAACIARRPSVRWLLPECERGANATALPTGIIEITEHDWWQLLAVHAVLLEWN